MCEELKKDLTDLAKKAMEIQDKYKGIGRVGLTTLSDCVIVSNAGSAEKDSDIHFCFEFNELKNAPTGIGAQENNIQQQDNTKERDFASVKLEKIAELIEMQVQDNLTKAPIHSIHEAYGLIKEELEEVIKEVDASSLRLEKMWQEKDDKGMRVQYLSSLIKTSTLLVLESFDLVSVSVKAYDQLKDQE